MLGGLTCLIVVNLDWPVYEVEARNAVAQTSYMRTLQPCVSIHVLHVSTYHISTHGLVFSVRACSVVPDLWTRGLNPIPWDIDQLQEKTAVSTHVAVARSVERRSEPAVQLSLPHCPNVFAFWHFSFS